MLWFAVWLGWQYTCWVTNWFEPDALPIRLLFFATMLLGLVMAAALPRAVAELAHPRLDLDRGGILDRPPRDG